MTSECFGDGSGNFLAGMTMISPCFPKSGFVFGIWLVDTIDQFPMCEFGLKKKQ